MAIIRDLIWSETLAEPEGLSGYIPTVDRDIDKEIKELIKEKTEELANESNN